MNSGLECEMLIKQARNIMARRKKVRVHRGEGPDWVSYILDKLGMPQQDLAYTAKENKYLENDPDYQDPYYHNILVGGANAAGKGLGGISYLPFGVLANGSNHELFRHNQQDKIKNAIQNALANGKHPRVFGHSWGGSTVANMAKEFPGVPFHALDSVSWTHVLESIPGNLTIYRPEEGRNNNDNLLASLAPIFGHRWPKITEGPGKTVEYRGGHVGGVDEAVNYAVYKAKRDRLSGRLPMENAVAKNVRDSAGKLVSFLR